MSPALSVTTLTDISDLGGITTRFAILNRGGLLILSVRSCKSSSVSYSSLMNGSGKEAYSAIIDTALDRKGMILHSIGKIPQTMLPMKDVLITIGTAR